MTTDELRSMLAEVTAEKNRISARESDIAHQLAQQVAAERGIAIGTVMTCTRKQGYAPNVKTVTKRIRVVAIKPSWRRDELKLMGATLRKDGSNGEIHELYYFDNWQIEANGGQQ